jgi:hypothetical protein
MKPSPQGTSVVRSDIVRNNTTILTNWLDSQTYLEAVTSQKYTLKTNERGLCWRLRK